MRSVPLCVDGFTEQVVYALAGAYEQVIIEVFVDADEIP
jgi:hypothetical protein